MKVLNLQCSHHHSFEGWFASEDDFQSQLSRGLVQCPLCEDTGIQKLPSAPRLNLGAQRPVPNEAATAEPEAAGQSASSTELVTMADSSPAPDNAARQAMFLKAMRHVMANTEDVGKRFAEEARRMHYGDIESRSIRGQASLRETAELIEEGIEVMPLPMPAAVKETLQ